MTHSCNVCQKPSSVLCSKCYTAYCSEQCRHHDWSYNNHRAWCNIGPPNKKRSVIHISGVPGSGKTTLGEFITAQNISSVAVVDTDTLIEHNTPNGDILTSLEAGPYDVYKQTWRAIFSAEISKAIEKSNASTVVFVGILDHWGGPDAEPVQMTQATHRFYIDIPRARLLYQFYSRLATIPPDDEYWHKAATGPDGYAIPGSKQLLNDASKTKVWHETHDYRVAPTRQIIGEILTIMDISEADRQRIIKKWDETPRR